MLNGYSAPLDMLPVFVRAGAVVPQGIAARNSALTPEDSAITVDIYPAGTSTFTLYEDDKTTRAYQSGAASSQEFTVSAPESDAGDVSVTVGARVGEYSGKSASRPYVLDVHSGTRPDASSETALPSMYWQTVRHLMPPIRAGFTTRMPPAAPCTSRLARSALAPQPQLY